MNRFYYQISCFIIFILTITVSCKKDWLEVRSSGNQAIPATLKDFQALLDYTTFMNSNVCSWGEIASDGHYITDNVWNSATSDNARNAYTWSHELPYSGKSSQSWYYTYTRVLNCNIVLDGLPKIIINSDAELTTWKDIKGQALFNRAEAFFHLAQLFAPVYNKNTAGLDMGIPMRLTQDVTEISHRSSVQDTYDLIIKDLKEAAELLPVIPLYPTRGAMPASFGLLSRIYLSMDEFDNSLLYADKCLQLDSNLIDYSKTSANQLNFNLFPKGVLFFNRMNASGIPISGFLTTNCLIDTALFNQYVNDDFRKTRFYGVTGNLVKFEGNYHNSSTDLFCGVATDEVLITRSECHARKSNVTKAMQDLNRLLSNCWEPGKFNPYAPADAIEALKLILRERKKQLVLRGLRWMDLRRLNKDERFRISLERRIGGKTYTLEPNSYKYTFPIPDDIIAVSNMPQNFGW